MSHLDVQNALVWIRKLRESSLREVHMLGSGRASSARVDNSNKDAFLGTVAYFKRTYM